ncbi:hypothetical protein ElyMa_001544100 [Elysia marginata]|uniref:Uncharacterized protein n=1 Tax=Elysia marginata TaxID=1093978 RepID=A0AAV4JEG7_9GAST|nr:hypothetical protein ElyMa_001544100 [Elysia marginata]
MLGSRGDVFTPVAPETPDIRYIPPGTRFHSDLGDDRVIVNIAGVEEGERGERSAQRSKDARHLIPVKWHAKARTQGGVKGSDIAVSFVSWEYLA